MISIIRFPRNALNTCRVHVLSGCTKATRNDKCDKGVLERPKQREIIVFREGASERVREREEGDEIRGIKAAMHALHPIIIPNPESALGSQQGYNVQCIPDVRSTVLYVFNYVCLDPKLN